MRQTLVDRIAWAVKYGPLSYEYIAALTGGRIQSIRTAVAHNPDRFTITHTKGNRAIVRLAKQERR